MNEKTCRAIVYERSGWLCEVWIPGVCLGRASNYQHRKGKAHCRKDELWAPENGLHVCGSGTTGCHGYIHQHPRESYSKGWSVRSFNNPEQCPAMVRGEPLFLMDYGYRTPEPGELIDTMRLAYPGGE